MAISTADDFWAWESWVDSANDPAGGFPLQSVPYCAFCAPNDPESRPHLGVGIGAFILDLHELSAGGQLASLAAGIQSACLAPVLNELTRCGRSAWSDLRRALIDLLRRDASLTQRHAIEPLLIPAESVSFVKPVAVGNYTDFYASLHHATNVGKLFRPDHPLLPNYKWIPLGYHGRASSILISGTEIRRPHGQSKAPLEADPVFGLTTQLDY